MKKIFLTLSFAIICIAVSAQRIGFIGGFQITSPYAVTAGKEINFNAKSGAGFHIGGYFDWDFSKRFGLDAQILYAMRNIKFDLQYQSDTTTHFVRNTFNFEIPLHVYANFHIKKGLILSPFLGPSVNIGLHGKDIAWQNTELQKPVDLQTKELYGKDNRINRFELAGEAGLAVKYKNYGIRASYSVGFTNLTTKKFRFTFNNFPDNRNRYLFNGVFKLSFVYVFDLRK